MNRLLVLVAAALLLCWTIPVATSNAAEPGTTFQDCANCPNMVNLPDGTAMGKFLLTRDEFAVFAKETHFVDNGCLAGDGVNWHNNPKANWTAPGFKQAGNDPVVCVSWTNATAYADWLSKKTGHSYRLPTVEESIVAAHSGGATKYEWGDNADDVCKSANIADARYKKAVPRTTTAVFRCDDGFTYTSPVDAYPPNAFGLYDMVGNAWEWTNSCDKGDCSNAIIRGSGWNVGGDQFLELSSSFAGPIALKNFVIGFRVLRDDMK